MKEVRNSKHELLQVIDRHILEINLLSAIDVCCVSENANGHPRPGNIRESANTD